MMESSQFLHRPHQVVLFFYIRPHSVSAISCFSFFSGFLFFLGHSCLSCFRFFFSSSPLLISPSTRPSIIFDVILMRVVSHRILCRYFTDGCANDLSVFSIIAASVVRAFEFTTSRLPPRVVYLMPLIMFPPCAFFSPNFLGCVDVPISACPFPWPCTSILLPRPSGLFHTFRPFFPTTILFFCWLPEHPHI